MDQIGKLIGKRKYKALKDLDLENITEKNLEIFKAQFKNLTVAEALKMISSYETKYTHTTVEQTESIKDYYRKIREPQPKKKVKTLSKEILWKLFIENFKKNEGVDFSKDSNSLENIKPLIYYFIGDLENFKKCKNVSELSKPSLKKGLLIIGGYGNGKTSIMKALERSLKQTNIVFRGYTTNEIVTMYEAIESNIDKEIYHKKFKTGTIYFDDVLTEREASNYGKIDLMKEVLEERYAKKLRTYITCNYKDGTGEDIKEGLHQFGLRYGSRVYDRLFEMFNIVEFKGKSFRL